MAAVSKRVAEQHEDWLNLADPEAPWFSLPVLKRVFPQGLDPTPPEVRAEHKARWYGKESEGARTADDRTEYLDWLLRDVLDWRGGYRTGAGLPTGLAAGVTRHGVTITPTGAYVPPASTPVGLFDDATDIADPKPETTRVLVFVLPPGTDPWSRPPGDTWPATWVQRAALSCRHTAVRLALVTDGDHLVLVNAPIGGATGWGSWRASEFAAEPILLDSFRSMLGSRRFILVEDKNTPEALLAESAGTQAEVTNQLGSQVRKATELLVNAISRANTLSEGRLLADVAPHHVYEAAVTVMMRLVFLLVAEENDLLPVDNSHYQRLYAVRTLRETLLEEKYVNPDLLENRTSAWNRLLATSRAVHSGVRHDDLTVPAYGGNLFDPDRFPFLEGRTRNARTWRSDPGAPIPITDLDVLAILDALLVLRFRAASGVTDTRRLSYRQVDVEQIGHIYERLLDHDAVAADNVVLGLTSSKDGEEPEVSLPEIEAKRIDGESALVAFLSNKDGYYVGTRNQVTKALGERVDSHLRARLLEACQSDQVLARRIEPYAHLLRNDLRERPMVFRPGAVYVTETSSRRDSGTAYTTRELADEVAEHALAPLCYSPGPQDTPDTNDWRIRPSTEILGLKVCDPTVGSGAILVAACRYLADRLIEAWRAEGDPRATDLATAADDPNRLDVIVDARRLVAEHCCYGVDRNPMAVELAKLSMWLTTVAKDRPFTFLDHAIKAGDSLLGIWDLDQLRYLHYDPKLGKARDIPIDGWSPGGDSLLLIETLVDQALELREEVQSLDTRNPADVECKLDLHRQSEQRLTLLAAIADIVAGAAISTAGQRNPSDALTVRLEAGMEDIALVITAAGGPAEGAALTAARYTASQWLDAGRPDGAPPRQPFHWPIAFPEVFAKEGSGFDVIVGNPPFVGGQKISGPIGTDYRDYLVIWVADGMRGSVDLVAYFFLGATRVAPSLGLLAINTLAQGRTSEVALAQIIDRDWIIYRAISSTTWPGENTLEICKVWITSRDWIPKPYLDDRPVVGIDETLNPISRSGWRKQVLAANSGKSFQGSIVLGMGFTMSPEDAQALIAKDPRNEDVLFPYIGGKELNESPTQRASRWVINFFDWSEERAREYPDCFTIVEERVKPERLQLLRKDYGTAQRRGTYWWQYAGDAKTLYRAIGGLDRALAMSRHSNTLQPAFVSTRQVLSEATVVFALADAFYLGILSSGLHTRWVMRHASTVRTDIRYSPTDVFETFPFPATSATVAEVTERLDRFRAGLMVRNDEGLTATYNRVHDPEQRDPDILKLRDLHVELDYAVRDAYGWDLALEHGFYAVRGQSLRFTFAQQVADEILDRLLELNKERYEDEVARGLHRKGNRAKTVTPRRHSGAGNQPSLLDPE